MELFAADYPGERVERTSFFLSLTSVGLPLVCDGLEIFVFGPESTCSVPYLVVNTRQTTDAPLNLYKFFVGGQEFG